MFVDIKKRPPAKFIEYVTPKILAGDFTYLTLWFNVIKKGDSFLPNEQWRNVQFVLNAAVRKAEFLFEIDRCDTNTLLFLLLFYQTKPFYNQVKINNLVKRLEENNETSNSNVLYVLSKIYAKGVHGTIYKIRGRKCLEQSAALGHPDALCCLAKIYELGIEGEAQDLAKAYEYFKRAANKGSAEALYQLALSEMNSNNEAQFKHYLNQAVKKGSLSAFSLQASIYIKGKIDSEIDIGILLMSRAIEYGSVDAMLRGAQILLDEGDEEYQKEAAFILNKAIQLNNSEAMVLRADMYKMESPPDFEHCIQLLERAIELNNSEAMVKRARLHLEGSQSDYNLMKAVKHLEHAIIEGNDEARILCNTLYEDFAAGDKENAQALLPMIWPDLLDGKSFTSHTTSALKKHCRDCILHKLTNEGENESQNLPLLIEVTRIKHPIARILNTKHEEEEHNPYLQVLKRKSELIEQKVTHYFNLYRKSGLSHYPADVFVSIIAQTEPEEVIKSLHNKLLRSESLVAQGVFTTKKPLNTSQKQTDFNGCSEGEGYAKRQRIM